MPVLVAMVAARPDAAAAAMLLAVVVAGLRIVRSVVRRPRRRQSLRLCPLCAAGAVRALEYEVVDALQARVRQQCGQCGVWREHVTSQYLAERQQRTLEADRTQIRCCAERLEREHMLAETDAFLAALRDGVVGVEDLLALIHADPSARGDQQR